MWAGKTAKVADDADRPAATTSPSPAAVAAVLAPGNGAPKASAVTPSLTPMAWLQRDNKARSLPATPFMNTNSSLRDVALHAAPYTDKLTLCSPESEVMAGQDAEISAALQECMQPAAAPAKQGQIMGESWDMDEGIPDMPTMPTSSHATGTLALQQLLGMEGMGMEGKLHQMMETGYGMEDMDLYGGMGYPEQMPRGGGRRGYGQNMHGHYAHHHHHHHHHHDHQPHHGGQHGGHGKHYNNNYSGMPNDQEWKLVRLQVDPRTTLDVPRHHLRFTHRAEAHLRNNGHVGWCQRHHNTGTCTFGQGCAFAHVVDQMVVHYRELAVSAVAAGAGGMGMGGHGGKGGKGMGGKHGGMHHDMGGKHGGMHHDMHRMGGDRGGVDVPHGGRGSRPPPLAGLSGAAAAMNWQGGAGHEEDKAGFAGEGTWQPVARGGHDAPPATQSKTLKSNLSSSAMPFTRPIRYWKGSNSTAEGCIFVEIREVVEEAIGELLKVGMQLGEARTAADDRLRSEISQQTSWSGVTKWLRKQPWGMPAAVAIDLCNAAGLEERPVEVLSGKMKKMLRSINPADGKIRAIDLSLSLKEANRTTPKGATTVAAELQVQDRDLTELTMLSMNHWDLTGNDIDHISKLLPPKVDNIEMQWVSGTGRWTGFAKLLTQLRERSHSSTLKISVDNDNDAGELLKAFQVLSTQTPVAPMVEVIIRCKAELTHEGRERLTTVAIEGLKITVPMLYMPPAPTQSISVLPEELRVVCYDLNYVDVAKVGQFLSSPEAEKVNRVFFRGITAPSAPMLSDCLHRVLANKNIVTLELQITRENRDRKGLTSAAGDAPQAVMAVLAGQAVSIGKESALRNLLIELKGSPPAEILEVMSLLPVKNLLFTAYSIDRCQLEPVLKPFVDQLKLLDPSCALTTVMIDYGRQCGRERGLCKMTGPWSKCHIAWLPEDEAEEVAEDMREARERDPHDGISQQFSALLSEVVCF